MFNNKKPVFFRILGIAVFTGSIITINTADSLPLRILCAAGCLAGTILVFRNIEWYNSPVIWHRLLWYALFFLIVPPTLNIIGWLVVNHNLPERIYYIRTINSAIVLSVVVCLFIAKEISRKRGNKQ